MSYSNSSVSYCTRKTKMDSEDNISSSPIPSPSALKSSTNVARIQRNVAEKQRRDKLNGYISELASIVPMVSMSSKRLDKTSILRLSAAHLRISKSPLCGKTKMKRSIKWCPSFLSNDQARHILESVDGFLILATSSGKILFTSHSVEKYLGHQDIDLIGHSLYTFIHPEDVDAVKDELNTILEDLLENDKVSRRCSFRCRLRERAQPRSDVVSYQFVHITGTMTSCDDEITSKSVLNHLFKAFVKVVEANPYNDLSLEEAIADEYVTRHSLDGTIIFADHRIATITGHMSHDVVGSNAYDYIHNDDASVALFAQHLMFSSDKGTGMIVYRLRRRDDKFCYLKSVGCLQFDKATNQVDHFVCVNQYLSDIDGNKQLKYFVDRYIPHIQGNSTAALFESVKAIQTSSTKTSNKSAKKEATVAKRQPCKTTSANVSHSIGGEKESARRNSGTAETEKTNVLFTTAKASPERPPVYSTNDGISCTAKGTLQFLEEYNSGSNMMTDPTEDYINSSPFDNQMLFSADYPSYSDHLGECTDDLTSLNYVAALYDDENERTVLKDVNLLTSSREDSESAGAWSDSMGYSSPSNLEEKLPIKDEYFLESTQRTFQ